LVPDFSKAIIAVMSVDATASSPAHFRLQAGACGAQGEGRQLQDRLVL
jgi:hypothetical protein